jgi:hypothetical protein
MKRSLFHLWLLIALCVPAFGLVPQPTSMTLDGGSLTYSSSTRIFYQTRTVSRTIETTLLPMAEVLAEELEITTGIKPTIIHNNGVNVPAAGDISLEFETVAGTFAVSEDQEDQSYTMTVSNKVVISSQYVKGVSYGTSTLIQSIVEASGSYSVPKMTIEDVPASDYRGLMVDVARDPPSLGTLKEIVRLARQYKTRYIHIHFTDDQHFTFPFTAVTSNLSNNFTYSRSDLQALNAYADARGVTIIPELEMPGHSGRLRASGYLSPGVGATESDAAAPANYAKLQAIIDDMLSVFTNTPYFHIGGDESSAGAALIPLVEAMNNHLRGKPAGQKKRLMVWEAFHGAPTTQIPATGDDRVIVLAWELYYNTPWDLLNNGYQLINASWKPMYVVGSGATNRMAHSQQLMWSPEEIHSWDKDVFSHFLPGMPAFEDAGPSDPVIGDGKWNAEYIGKEDQVIGGQLISWEQNEKVIIRDLQDRLPAAADRMWNPLPSESFTTFNARYQAVKERAMSIVQPIEILPLSSTPDAPYTADYRYYSGSNVQITLRNRTKIPGTIRYNLGTFNNSRDSTNFGTIADTTGSSTAYSAPFTSPNGGFGIRARLHRSGGTPVEGHAIAHFNNWANNIKVTEYEVPRHPLPSAPDFASYTSSKIERSFSQPIFRGPYVTDATKGQMFRATLDAPGSGTYTMRVETGGGFATMYVDTNRNGIWEDSEKVFSNFNGAATNFTVTLDSNPYQFRVDHATNGLSSLLMMSMNGPGTSGAKDIATYLTPPVEPSALPAVPQLLGPAADVSGMPSAITFSWSSDRADDYRLFVWPTSQSKPLVPTVADLATNSHRLTGLMPGVRYRWTVVARNGSGSNESVAREFTTFDSANFRSIGWNYDAGSGIGNDTLTSTAVAGLPPFAQAHWNNHSSPGQGSGTTPFALVDNTGSASGARVSSWSVTSTASWFYGYSGSDPNSVLMNAFNGREASLTFADIPSDYQEFGYNVVVYYGNNEGPSNSVLTVDGSVDDLRSRNIRTGNTLQAAHHNVGFIEATDVSGAVSNCTVFSGLNDPSFTVSLAGANNNGIAAVQIIRIGPPPGLIEPGPVTTYEPFYASEWDAEEISTDYYPWTGEEITFMTMTDDLDAETMTTLIGLLDGGWKLYRDLTGRSPTLGQRINGKPVIAAIPYDAPTCGIGCGFLGHEGIETTGFYTVHYPDLLLDPTAVAHLYFYEMGRNYYTFGAKHENFITGFAVFMRYVCIDTLGVNDIEPSEREKVDDAIDTYVSSGTHSFLETFTNGYGLTEKMERIPGADQPVMYASAMLKLWKLLGDEWLADFYAQIMTCPDGSIATQQGARSNALSWFVSASRAAEQDLSSIFVTQWRMILTAEEQAVLAGVDWDDPAVDAGDIVQAMQYATKPTAVAPADSAINVHPRQTLHWDFTGGTTYDIYLWVDGNSKPGTPTASGLTTKFYEPSVLSSGTTYHWAVVAHHPLGTTESNTFTFTTILTPISYSSVGWNFDYSAVGSDTVGGSEFAGVPAFAQQNWNNHASVGQNVGTLPLSLVDNTGASSGIQLTGWTLSGPNSWYQGYSGSSPNAKLMNSFTNQRPSLTFSGVPADYRDNGYMVIVYYGNNEGPSTSVITLTGSVDDSRTRTVTTGNGALSAYHQVGFVEGTPTSTVPSNYTVFTGLNDTNFTLAFTNANNNGICAVQIVKMPTPPSAGFIGWNYDMGYTPSTYDTVGPTEIAGAPGFEQDNWNNHTGAAQGAGSVPFSLNDSDGNASGTQVTAWSVNTANSWTHGYSGSNADSKLMNSFNGMRPSITFSNIPVDYQGAGYSVVVYYGNNEGPSNSVLTLTGSVNDSKSRTIRTGTTTLSGHHVVGYIEGDDTLGTPTNYTVFTGLDDASFTVALANANNNGICAVQIVRADSSNETEGDPLSGFAAWQDTSPGAGTSATSDNDKDGWVDLVEYALGTSPADGVTPNWAPRMDDASGTADFVYSRPAGLTDVNYTLEGSINCVDWHPITDIAPIVEVNGDWEHIRYKNVRSTTDVPGMEGSSSSFFRLSLKQP